MAGKKPVFVVEKASLRMKNRVDQSRKVQFMCSCFTDFFPHSSISSGVSAGSCNDAQNTPLPSAKLLTSLCFHINHLTYIRNSKAKV